jgi:aminoglycoside phosphotransferase (APT) family kinase protein
MGDDQRSRTETEPAQPDVPEVATGREPGELLGAGRDAQVYEYGEGRILRRYTTPRQTASEAAVMTYAHEHGYPVPMVYGASGPDLVMERLTGPTMLDDIGRRPWRASQHAHLLAELHRQLHELPAPDWLEESVGEGDRLLHLDLHPGNVVLAERGPVVIDWSNAARGPWAVDVALTWLIIGTAKVPGGPILRPFGRVAGRLFSTAFLEHFERAELVATLPVAAGYRTTDPHVEEPEREAVRAFVERELGGGAG